MVDGLLAQCVQERKLHGLRDEGQSEVEVEDVGTRREPRERRELLSEPLRQRPVPLEGDVRLGVKRPALEDDEASVDPQPPQRLHVLPRDPGRVDGTVRHPQPVGRHRVRPTLWIVRHSSVTSFGEVQKRP